MDDLFTVISLVIGIAGAYYTAFLAVRSSFQEQTKASLNSADEFITCIRDANNDRASKDGERKYSAVRRSAWIWRWSMVIPGALFFLIIHGLALHVCIAYRPSVEMTPASCWNVYWWVIGALMLLDFLCLIASLVTSTRIIANAEDLTGCWKIVLEERSGMSRKEQPQPVRPPDPARHENGADEDS